MRNLFERLPYDSETYSEIGEKTPESKLWGPEMYMLANLIDAVNYCTWSVQAVNSKHPPRQPKPFKRPSVTKENKKVNWPGRTIIDKGGNSG